jgi:D-aminopeptidase
LPLRIVASINVGVISEYNNKEGAANLNSKAPRIKLKVAFKESVYAKGGSFIPRREEFIRGHRILLQALSLLKLAC